MTIMTAAKMMNTTSGNGGPVPKIPSPAADVASLSPSRDALGGRRSAGILPDREAEGLARPRRSDRGSTLVE